VVVRCARGARNIRTETLTWSYRGVDLVDDVAGDRVSQAELLARPGRNLVPAELSVGERQRVALARALFHRPKLVLADEPTGNLDPNNAVTVLDALREYADAGAAVLMVTHDPHAAQRAHRVLHMDRGHLV